MRKISIFSLLLCIVLLFGCAGNKGQEVLRQKTVKFVKFKKFPVLEYHLIKNPEGRWARTPENFASDIEWLYKNNYYPINLKDIIPSAESLPQGKTPVVLTFDDSTSGQFRYLPDGSVDPNCAVGIIKAFHEKHPDEWPMKATFFVLIKTTDPDHDIFGQPEHPDYKAKKLRQLAEWGMEVASHTYSHDRLDNISPAAARKKLTRAYMKLKEMSGQEIVSIAPPMGLYPKDESVFGNFKFAVEVDGGLEQIPSAPGFNPLHIHRVQAIASEWKKFFGRKH